MAKKRNKNRALQGRKQTAWNEARKRYRLSRAQVQMARELGMNPRKLGGLANHDQEPWKMPLPEYIEHLYQKRFSRARPDAVRQSEEPKHRSEQEAHGWGRMSHSEGSRTSAGSELGVEFADWDEDPVIALTTRDIELLRKHIDFYLALDHGRRPIDTEAQGEFVRVCRGKKAPQTEHEFAYVKVLGFARDYDVRVEQLRRAQFDIARLRRQSRPSVQSAVSRSSSAHQPRTPRAETERQEATVRQAVAISSDPGLGSTIVSCATCGEPIPPARLEAVPLATQCVTCQERLEQGEEGSVEDSVRSCPRCKVGYLVERTQRDPRKSGYFFGCSRFPQCRYTE